MKIVCDACGAKYSIADEKVAGKVFKIRCKKCSNIIVVRGNSGEEAAAAAPPAQEQQPNKETKVFDYQGYDSPQDAMAAADEGEWHLVIDQEQVGPMTADEVRLRFASGEVDSESYIWKEGFADWEHIPDVPEFADLAGIPAEAALADDGNMFGISDPLGDATSEAPAPAAMAAVSNDLFGDDAGGGADLFGGAAAAGSDLFGGGAPVGDHTGEIAMSKEAEAQLKGQRNENSVLFSLGNLAALASDTPKSVAPTASSSGGISNTGGSEGSGLIDIRSMASVYLADKGGASAAMPAGSTDDLPVFSQSAFESASPVLLPTQSGGTDKKVLYALIGVIGALLIAAAILLMVVLGGDDEPTADEVAAAERAMDEASDTGEAENAEVDTEPATENVGDPTEAVTDPATEPTEAVPETAPDPESKPEPKGPAASRRDKRKEREAKRAQKNPTRTPKPRTPDPKPTKSSSCDEVTCLVNPNASCCRKTAKKSGSGDSGSKSSSNSNLPEKPSRSQIASGISRVKGRVSSCGDKHNGKGRVTVKIKIGGNGKVTSAQASGGSSALRSCVTSAVKRAKFPKTQKGVTVNYPFKF